MGAKNTTDFLEKATWTLAISLIVLILVSNIWIERPDGVQGPKGESTETPYNFEDNFGEDSI